MEDVVHLPKKFVAALEKAGFLVNESNIFSDAYTFCIVLKRIKETRDQKRHETTPYFTSWETKALVKAINDFEKEPTRLLITWFNTLGEFSRVVEISEPLPPEGSDERHEFFSKVLTVYTTKLTEEFQCPVINIDVESVEIHTLTL